VRLGIDFGTTRIVVAAADRGNYPLVNFETPDGQARDWFPSVAAISDQRRVYGWEALELHGQPGWTLLRSLKRGLKTAGPHTEIEVDGQCLNLSLLITEMLSALRHDLTERSTLGIEEGAKLQAMLGVPANSNSNQRFLTEETARAAGFDVLGLANEPSAAAIEYAHGSGSDRQMRENASLLVYDLGGGTFDASLVTLGDAEYSVIASDGISDFGGDDFDEILAELALEEAGVPESEQTCLSDAERFVLLEECREKKETLNPNSRRVTVDLGRVRQVWQEVSIPVEAFYEHCRPLIEASRGVVERLIAACPEQSIDTLYLTGGGSELPPVARILREGFGRKVKRSAYMRSATAIGLAIRAAEHEECVVHEQFAQNFGVWREADAGRNVVFDVMFPRGSKLPAKGQEPLRIVRTYRPVHNVGHFRYLECSHLDSANQPQGEISNWDEIRVLYDSALRSVAEFPQQPKRCFAPGEGPLFEEEYTCDSNGQLRVRISDKSADYVQEYRLGHWSKDGERPAKKRSKTGTRLRKRN
jgi:molecular chaperone DnaK (HSP70)